MRNGGFFSSLLVIEVQSVTITPWSFCEGVQGLSTHCYVNNQEDSDDDAK